MNQDKLSSLSNTPKSEQFQSFANVTNITYDTPKRSRFSFKPEHLVVIQVFDFTLLKDFYY